MKQLFILFSLAFSFSMAAQDISVMSYNIRLDIASDGENRWDNRKEMLAGQVLFYEPDFLGVQEALPNQVQFLNSQLKEYKFIGVGRDDGKDKGEYSAVFYNSVKYKLLESNTFWLSETPEKPSKGWDAAYNRVCTYGMFQNLKTKKKILVFNTHFDHVGNVARAESARLILQKIREINKNNLPVIVTGDFNLEPGTEPVNIIKSELNDSRGIADLVYGPDGTFNAFEFHKPVTNRIDYIFVPKSGVSVKKYAILSDSKNCRYPSDHLPVYVELVVK